MNKDGTHLSSLSLLEVVSELSSNLIIAFCSQHIEAAVEVFSDEQSDEVEGDGERRRCSCLVMPGLIVFTIKLSVIGLL